MKSGSIGSILRCNAPDLISTDGFYGASAGAIKAPACMDFLTLHKSFVLKRIDPKPEKKEPSAEKRWTTWLGIPGS